MSSRKNPKKQSIFDSSGSDDDLTTSVKSFGDIFSQIHKKAKEDFKPIEASSTKVAKKSPTDGRKRFFNSSKSDISTHKPLPDKPNKSDRTSRSKKTRESIPVALSDDTEDLLAQVNKLKQSKSKKETEVDKNISNHKTSKSKKSPNDFEEIVLSDASVDDDVLDVSLPNIPEEDDVMFCEEVPLKQNSEPICTVRVRWETDVLRFIVLQSAKMSTVRMELAKKLNKRADNVVIIDPNNEEVSDNLLVANVSFGTMFESFIREDDHLPNKTKKLDPNYLELKVQGSGGYRERLTVYIQRTTHIKQLIEDFSEKFKKDKKYKLIFDGDSVDLTETPETLDLDGGEMFDIVEI